MEEKTCSKCGKTKPFSEFYTHPQMSDGYYNKCKECYKAYYRNHPNKEEYNERQRERQKAEEGRQRHNKSVKKSKEKYKQRRKANTAVTNAIRAGKLTKLPCFVCGELKVEAHHPNYDAPLDVIWLCVKHHKEVHKRYDEEEDLRIIAKTKEGK